jgi:hypothetical protein
VTKVRVGAAAPFLGDLTGGAGALAIPEATTTFWAMLQMIPKVSEKKAAAVVARFPTLRAL